MEPVKFYALLSLKLIKGYITTGVKNSNQGGDILKEILSGPGKRL